MMTILKNIWTWIGFNIISKVQWQWLVALFRKNGKYWDLTAEDWQELNEKCSKNHYVILIRRKCHLTTYLISIATFIKTGKWGYWSHAFMNLENEVAQNSDFRFVEATSSGVHYSTFEEVFDCDSVCLLRPKGFTDEDWTEAMDRLRTDIGKAYDMLFDLSQNEKLSCVEMVLDALKGAQDFNADTSHLQAVMMKTGDLIPDMFYNCGDFDVVFEKRR